MIKKRESTLKTIVTDQHVFKGYLTIPELDYEEEIELVADVHYTPPTRGERDKYGAPLEPDYPEEIEVDNIRNNDLDPEPWKICIADDLANNPDLNFDGLIEEWKESVQESIVQEAIASVRGTDIGDDESLVDYQDRMSDSL